MLTASCMFHSVIKRARTSLPVCWRQSSKETFLVTCLQNFHWRLQGTYVQGIHQGIVKTSITFYSSVFYIHWCHLLPCTMVWWLPSYASSRCILWLILPHIYVLNDVFFIQKKKKKWYYLLDLRGSFDLYERDLPRFYLISLAVRCNSHSLENLAPQHAW